MRIQTKLDQRFRFLDLFLPSFQYVGQSVLRRAYVTACRPMSTRQRKTKYAAKRNHASICSP